jgi:ABC-type uncharacterized transport system substrate-binding protein
MDRMSTHALASAATSSDASRLRRCCCHLNRYPWNWLAAIIVACACLTAPRADAHPHVWVTMSAELLYAPDGLATGVRHAWTFDDMYSAFATTGIEAKTKGQFTREELQPLAQINAESLKDFDYFTYAKVNGKKLKGAFSDPVDYWLDYNPKETVLTLHFTLPFKTAVKAKVLTVEVYDPEFFIDFGFAEKDPVKLVGAPSQCAAWIDKPHDDNFFSPQSLNRAFIPSEANIGMGANFANKILVQCP